MNTYGLMESRPALLEKLSKRKQEHGFSLIELIVVVAIIGIISAIAIPVFLNAQDNARQAAVEDSAQAGLTTAATALLQGEGVEARLAEVSDQNDDVNLTLIAGAGSMNPDDLCVQASYVGTDNIAGAGIGCEGLPLGYESFNTDLNVSQSVFVNLAAQSLDKVDWVGYDPLYSMNTGYSDLPDMFNATDGGYLECSDLYDECLTRLTVTDLKTGEQISEPYVTAIREDRGNFVSKSRTFHRDRQAHDRLLNPDEAKSLVTFYNNVRVTVEIFTRDGEVEQVHGTISKDIEYPSIADFRITESDQNGTFHRQLRSPHSVQIAGGGLPW